MDSNSFRTNPWLGLRTYAEGEVIYGRSEEIATLSQLVLRNTQTVVYGRSGIGKSSILNAGVFPIARRHGVLPVYIRLEHNAAASYLRQIKAAVSREFGKLIAGGKATETELVAASGKESLWEYFHRIEYRDHEGHIIRPLVVFDQFEEIFTLESSREKRDNFFRELADLINNVMPEGLADVPGDTPCEDASEQDGGILDLGLGLLSDTSSKYKNGSDFHLIFTLREDFLSYLERNTTDIPELKNNRYCLQPINEEQAADIIMQPRKGLVSKEVATLIISHVTGEDDFQLDGIPEIQVDSAILSLYLSRLYDKMLADGGTAITAELVEAYSDNIIEDFYTDAINGLSPASVQWMEDTLVNDDGRRDNRDRLTVMREGQLSDNDIKRLTDSVKLLRQFSYGGDLRVEYIHDVLCPVIVKRRNKRNEEHRIAELAEAAAREKRRARKNVLIVSLIAIGIAAAAVGAYLWDQYQYAWEVSEAYPHYETCHGWPVGIGPRLTKDEMSRTPRYYVLSKKGHSAPHFTTVTVSGSNAVNTDEPAATPFELTGKIDESIYDYDKRTHMDSVLAKVYRMDFMPSMTGDIDYIAFLDREQAPLFTAKRYTTGDGENYSFDKPDGTPFAISYTGADRLRLSTDSLGFITSIVFENAEGVKLSNDADTYGYFKTVNPDSSSVTLTRLNEFGQPRPNRNTVRNTFTGAKSKETIFFNMDPATFELMYSDVTNGINRILSSDSGAEFFNASGELVLAQNFKRDSKGNIIEITLTKGDPNKSFPAKAEFKYDAAGRLTGETKYNAADIAFVRTVKAYDASGALTYEETIKDGICELLYRRTESPGMVKTERQTREKPYMAEIDSTLADGTHIICFFDSYGNPVNSESDGTLIHKRIVRHLSDGKRETEYYIFEDNEVHPLDGDGTYFRMVESLDESGHQLTTQTFNPAGEIITSMRYYYQNGQLIGRAAMGIDGEPVRCPDWEAEGFGYYRMYFNTDNNGDYTHIQTVNEAGMQCTLYWKEINDYLEISYQNLKNCIVELEDNPYMPPLNPTALINKDYSQFVGLKAYDISDRTVRFLHLLDKDNALYRAGLRDGDIILAPESLLGASGIDVTHITKDLKFKRRSIKFESALTKADLEHIHIHPLRLSFWEDRNFKRIIDK